VSSNEGTVRQIMHAFFVAVVAAFLGALVGLLPLVILRWRMTSKSCRPNTNYQAPAATRRSLRGSLAGAHKVARSRLDSSLAHEFFEELTI